MKLDVNTDIGYIIKGGNYLPLRPMIVDKKLVKDPNYKVKNNEKLLIHEDIIKYYIATKTININSNLYEYNRIYLYEALTSLGFSVIIRACHQLIVFLPDHLSKDDYNNINIIVNSLNEPINELGHLYINSDNNIECEKFDNLISATKTLNKRYKEEKEGNCR